MAKYDPAAYRIDLTSWPSIVTNELPGPKSVEMHARASQNIRGLSGQVRLFPVVFEKGFGNGFPIAGKHHLCYRGVLLNLCVDQREDR